MIPGQLSIVLPNYNHAAYVGGQLTGILSQSYHNLQLIVIDDGSTDNSVEVIKAAIGDDPRVTFLQNEKNLGCSPTVERGRKLVTGEFIYFCAADDRVMPGFFEKSISAMQQAPQAAVCFTQMAWIDQGGMTATPMPLRITDQPTFLSPDAFCEVMCGEHHGGASVIHRTEPLASARPAEEDYNKLQWHVDWFMASVLACRHGTCYIPEPLVAIRMTGGNFFLNMYNYDLQKEVVKTAIRLLKTEYRDVLPYFAKGALFSGLPHVGKTFLNHPELWDMETLMLVQKSVSDWNAERREFQKSRWVKK